MVKENTLLKQVKYMKEIFLMELEQELQYIPLLMEINMKEIGEIMLKMEVLK